MQSPKEEHRYLVGLDLGQANDYTALGILHQKFVESRHRFEYELPYLERVRGMPYPLIVDKVEALLKKPELQASEPPLLIIDKTGVGAPVCDMFNPKLMQIPDTSSGLMALNKECHRNYHHSRPYALSCNWGLPCTKKGSGLCPAGYLPVTAN